MLVIRMELWPHGVEAEAEVLATATIINDGTGGDGTGNSPRGNYHVELYNGRRSWKKCRVENFPRKKLLGWDILCRALFTMLGDRNDLGISTAQN